MRNGHICEYRERKKPGLRAGYGRELEARLGEFVLWVKCVQLPIMDSDCNILVCSPL